MEDITLKQYLHLVKEQNRSETTMSCSALQMFTAKQEVLGRTNH
jgi:hypothetical protein